MVTSYSMMHRPPGRLPEMVKETWRRGTVVATGDRGQKPARLVVE